MAASAALVERTVPACSPAPLAPSIAPPPPKPPAMMAGIERFIATAMRFVRIEPEAPTIIPATISAGLSRAIPVAAADRPVKAFRREITTGMSAPPIGRTTALPRRAAQTSIPMKITSSWAPAAMSTPAATARMSRTRFTICWAEPNEIGLPGMISWSFPKAIFEPQKDTEPTIAANSEKIVT